MVSQIANKPVLVIHQDHLLQPLDGASLAPLLLGMKVDWGDRMLFEGRGNRAAVRTQRHRTEVARKGRGVIGHVDTSRMDIQEPLLDFTAEEHR